MSQCCEDNMREIKDLAENQTEFYYQTYLGKTDEVDAKGYKTGKKVPTYSKPVKAIAMISANTSDVELTPFGKDAVYDKMISTVQNLPITETTQLFIDIVPDIDEEGNTSTKADYEVVRVAKGLHQNVWAIRKVEGYEQNNYG